MNDILNLIKVIFAAIGAFLGAFLGGLDGMLYALIVVVALDYVTGLMAAAIEKKISSAVGFKGICKKLVIFALVGLAQVIDSKLIGNGSIVRTAVIMFYVANEGISVTENAARIGIPLPKKLLAVLIQLQKKSESDESDE